MPPSRSGAAAPSGGAAPGPAPTPSTVAYALVGAGRLSPVEESRALDREARGRGHYWVDLEGPSSEELAGWLRALAVPEMLAKLVTDPSALDALGEPASGAAVLDGGVYFFLPFYGSDDFSTVSPLRVVCTPDVLLTFHEAPLPALRAAMELAVGGDLLPAPSVSGAVSALLQFCARRTVGATGRLRTRLAGLAQRLASANPQIEPAELLACDETLHALDATVDEQLASIRQVAKAHSSALDMAALADRGQVALGILETLGRSVDRLERRTRSIQSQYDSLLAQRSNRRISTLTILTAVFMPATLLAGIFGMNFDDMPLLHDPYGYPATLGAMAFIAVSGMGLLWKYGWFR